jgi:2-oxo-3-hexenedioate decarboxylase
MSSSGDGADRAVMRAADVVLDAFASQRLIAPLSDGDPSLDEDGAYAIAQEIHARRIRRGEKPVGRKIGFTNRSIWAEFRVRAPIWGHVYDSTVQSAPAGEARLAVGQLLQPRIEPEIQLHFARTPLLTRDEGAILDCIDWIAQGFEIVQSPFPDWRFRAVDTIAACAVHGALVVGRPVAVTEIEDCAAKLRSFTVTMSRDGVEQATGSGANVLDSPLLAFAHLVEILAEQSRFAPVQAGEIVSTGSLTAVPPVAPGETWSTTLEGISLPGLSVSLV